MVELEQIAEDIASFCATWGRINVTQAKEKYGTVRVYCCLGVVGLHSLVFPRSLYKHLRFPTFLWNLDILYIEPFFSKFHFIILPYQVFIYRLAYKRAIRQHPDKLQQIVRCMDYPDVLFKRQGD